MCKLKPRRVSPRRCQTNPNRPTDIKLLSFNVENLMPKLEEPSFIDLINAHDICLFYETWNKVDEKIGIPDYWDFSQVRPKYKKIGRYSGGITVMVKDDLRSGIQVVHNTEGFIWLKLDKTFLNLDNDLYICAAYIPPARPSNSPNQKNDYFQDFVDQILNFINKGNLLFAGDFNSRLGNSR